MTLFSVYVCVSHYKPLDLFEEYYSHKYYDTVRHGNQYIVFWCTISVEYKITMLQSNNIYINTFTAIVDLSRFNNSCLKSPLSTLVDLTFQSRALRSFSLNQLRNLSL